MSLILIFVFVGLVPFFCLSILFCRSLHKILQSANITDYISGCAHTTAAFAVLSDTLRTIRTVLVDIHARKDLEQLLTKLQAHEKEKLTLTAAYHLEKIRERNETMTLEDEKSHDNNNTRTTDHRIGQLLSQGITSLQEKLKDVVEDINECLEEIRYLMIEEEGEEDDE
jgi:DNA repair REX1-B